EVAGQVGLPEAPQRLEAVPAGEEVLRDAVELDLAGHLELVDAPELGQLDLAGPALEDAVVEDHPAGAAHLRRVGDGEQVPPGPVASGHLVEEVEARSEHPELLEPLLALFAH